jgi:hypothetical protein
VFPAGQKRCFRGLVDDESGGGEKTAMIDTNVGKLSVLENEKVVLAREALELDDEIVVKVGKDINVSLIHCVLCI